VCDSLLCLVSVKLGVIFRAVVLHIFIFQEVLDLNPRVIILTLRGDYTMVIFPVESENCHMTTHTPHGIMIVVMDWPQVLTAGKGAWKIALIGRSLCGFSFYVFCNVCFVCIWMSKKNSISLIAEVGAIKTFMPFLRDMNISNLPYNLKYQ
jgi:hypothetical protein